MSGVSEAGGIMTSRELFTVNPTMSTQNQAASQLDQQMRVPYATDGAYRPTATSPPQYQSMPSGAPVVKHAMNLNSGEQKRKRGRPRKYGPDSGVGMAMVPAQQPIGVVMPQTQTFSSPSMGPSSAELQAPAGGSASPTAKKARGRPPGSSNKKKQMEAIGNNI